MPKQTYFTRYSLIIKRLERGPATFEQLYQYLQREFELIDQPFSWSRRTLQRDIKDIYESFQLEILNEQKGDRCYFLASKPENRQVSQRLLDAWELVHILKTSQNYSDAVMLEERKPDGLQHFHGLLFAIQNKRITSFTHIKYYDETISERKVHPLALKESLGRWYLLAVDTHDRKLKTFSLDRIRDIDISKTAYRDHYDYDVKHLFKHSFGIIQGDGEPQKIRLAFSDEQANYIRSFPLHHSQVIFHEEQGVVIELKMVITHDLVMELMKYGPEVKVLEPEHLKQEIRHLAKLVVKNYG